MLQAGKKPKSQILQSEMYNASQKVIVSPSYVMWYAVRVYRLISSQHSQSILCHVVCGDSVPGKTWHGMISLDRSLELRVIS